MAKVLAWETKNQPFYESLRFVPLSDSGRIETTLKQGIERSSSLRVLDQQKRERLVAALGLFFNAFAQEDAAEYLRIIEPSRNLPESPQELHSVLTGYKLLTGRPFPAELTAREAFEVLWKGRTSRILSVSLGDARGLAFHVSEWDGTRHAPWISDDSRPREFDNPASSALVAATIPRELEEATIKSDGRSLRCMMDFVARDSRSKYVPMDVKLFWSSLSSRWILLFVNNKTDEKLGWTF